MSIKRLPLSLTSLRMSEYDSKGTFALPLSARSLCHSVRACSLLSCSDDDLSDFIVVDWFGIHLALTRHPTRKASETTTDPWSARLKERASSTDKLLVSHYLS